MRNLKHTIAALVAVSLVGSLAAYQAMNLSSVNATKLTQETRAVVASSPAEPEKESPEDLVGKDAFILTQSGGNINLRAAKDTESTILDVLDVGTEVSVISYEDDWFHVETDGYKGYVKSEFVTLDYEKVKEVLLTSVMYLTGTATISTNVRGMADESSLILDQVGQGSKVVILETTDNGWHKVYFGDNYDIGYISAANISIGDMVNRAEINAKRSVRIFSIAKDAKITTTESSVAVKLLPSSESETLTTLANGANCKVVSGGKNWTKIIVLATNELGYVRTSNIKQISTVANTKSGKSVKIKSSASVSGSASGSKLVAQASKYIGTKYVYGGTSPSGFDCSGLVQYSLRKLGVSISRSSSSQYSYGTPVSRANLQPGDLVFFSRGSGISHVAIYAGNGQVIHAPRAGKTVCYQSMSSLSGAMRYVGAKRIF